MRCRTGRFFTRVVMRRLCWCAVFGAAGGVFVPVLPETPVVTAGPTHRTVDLEQEVRGLVADLAGETRARRLAAEKRLLELGPRVLPLLPASELLPTVSVREAVRRIRVELERAQARESVLPSGVTLAGKESLAETLAELTRQTGNRLDGHLLPDETLKMPVELPVESALFWPVLDDLAARLNLQYEFDGGLRGLRLEPARSDRRPIESAPCYAGAFRVSALPAEHIRRGFVRENGQNPRRGDDLARVTLLLMPEPRLRPLFLQFAMSEISAWTKDKRELKAFSPEASYELALGEGGGQSRIQLDFLLPQAAAGQLLNLKGKLRCTTAAGNEPIRFTDLTQAQGARGGNVARRRGGVTVTLNRVRKEPSSPGKQKALVQVTVTYDAGGPAFESHQRWILHNEVFLEDRAGKRINLNGGSETTAQGEGGVGIEYHFTDFPEPIDNYSFVYVAPTLIVDVPIEFEIQSVPVGKK